MPFLTLLTISSIILSPDSFQATLPRSLHIWPLPVLRRFRPLPYRGCEEVFRALRRFPGISTFPVLSPSHSQSLLFRRSKDGTSRTVSGDFLYKRQHFFAQVKIGICRRCMKICQIVIASPHFDRMIYYLRHSLQQMGRTSLSKVRTPTAISAVSGIMLDAVPPPALPTVRATVCLGSVSLPLRRFRAV